MRPAILFPFALLSIIIFGVCLFIFDLSILWLIPIGIFGSITAFDLEKMKKEEEKRRIGRYNKDFENVFIDEESGEIEKHQKKEPLDNHIFLTKDQNKIQRKHLYPKKGIEEGTHFFTGKKVVISGMFDHFYQRDEMAKWLWEVGADVDTQVTENTDFLIAGEGVGWRKKEIADTYGAIIMNEEEFISYFPMRKIHGVYYKRE